jgi:hypothetical protein
VANRYKVQRWLPEGRYSTEYVVAWDFSIVGDSLVFTNTKRTVAYRDWISVKQED